jgi:hypothetical protein
VKPFEADSIVTVHQVATVWIRHLIAQDAHQPSLPTKLGASDSVNDANAVAAAKWQDDSDKNSEEGHSSSLEATRQRYVAVVCRPVFKDCGYESSGKMDESDAKKSRSKIAKKIHA